MEFSSREEKKCKKPVLRILMVIVLTGCLLIAGFAWTDKTVTLSIDGKNQTIETFTLTVGQLLQAEDIQLGEYDRVEPAQNEFLREGMTVTVTRAVPVTLKVDGTAKKVNVYCKTVQDLLDEFGITLQEEDYVLPSPETGVKKGMTIEVVRQRTDVVEEEVSIPNNTVRQENPNLPSGKTKVVQEGRPGLEKKVWQITYRNGKEATRELQSSELIREPVDRIVQIGTAKMISRGGRTVRYSRAAEMVSTAYTYTGNNTATGVPPKRGVAAVDPSVIPLGTKLYVEGYGYCTALDRGSAIKGNKIDVFMETRNEAYKWGVRRVKVYVLE